MEKRKNRSDSYQFLILETSCSNEMMESFSNNDSISSRLNPFQYDEELLDLEDQLKIEFWRIVESLTDRQKEVVKLYSKGMTQMEIAKSLKVNQSSITKSLHGNVDYSACINQKDKFNKSKSKEGKRIYGGTEKKLRKIIETDEKIKEILQKMQEIREEKW